MGIMRRALVMLMYWYASLLHAMTYHAYIDTSYNYLQNKNTFTSGAYNRVFDREPNGFTLQQVGFSTAYEPPQGLGGYVYLIGGADANVLAPSGWDPNVGSQTLALFPNDAYLQYALDKLMIRAGILSSLVGIEANDASQDDNFSRSILNGAQPGSATGVRAIYTIKPNTHFYFGLGNGLTTFRQPLRLTMAQLGIDYVLQHRMSLAVQASNGNNQVVPGAVTGPMARFNLWDIILKYQATRRTALALDTSLFQQAKGQRPDGQTTAIGWQGIAGYIAYDFYERWRIATRAEWFNDGDGFISGVRQHMAELTLTVQFEPKQHWVLRAETRRDVSNVNAYRNQSGHGTRHYQQSFALETLYVL